MASDSLDELYTKLDLLEQQRIVLITRLTENQAEIKEINESLKELIRRNGPLTSG